MDDKLSVSESKGLGNNHTMWCDKHDQRRHYGACIWQVEAYDEDRLETGEHNDCANAMCAGNCVAKKMREEEIAAGHAIYFREKNVVNKHESVVNTVKNDSYKRGWNQVGSSAGKTDDNYEVAGIPRAVVKRIERHSDSAPIVKTVDMADVITKAVAEESKKISMAEFVKMKREVILLSKTNMAKAKKLLIEVKRIESNNLVTA